MMERQNNRGHKQTKNPAYERDESRPYGKRVWCVGARFIAPLFEYIDHDS